MKKVMFILGTRPNYMKAYPLYKELQNKYQLILVHTGQHYDNNMFQIFFDEFSLPKPDIQINLNNKDPLLQLGEMITELSKIAINSKPDLIIVFGDVTSTLAGALVSNKLNIKLAHIESGLRSFDRSMPEEINRILTDQITDYFFITEPSGISNLLASNLSYEQKQNLYFVGNTMIDTLVEMLPKIKKIDYYKTLNLSENNFIIVTLHRPSNVDNIDQLIKIVDKLNEINYNHQIVWPIHPRTKKRLIESNLNISKFITLEPLGYIEFMNLVYYSKLVITDSGGIQEETTFLSKPCLTLRENTERPITLIKNGGTNKLTNLDNLLDDINNIVLKKTKIKKWDGNACKRIENILNEIL